MPPPQQADDKHLQIIGSQLTRTEPDHFVDFFNSAGYDKEVGLPIHIQDGGVVIRDAGYILFNPDESVAFIHGPHPFLEGDTAAYCAALS
jgi:hypothetical protein